MLNMNKNIPNVDRKSILCVKKQTHVGKVKIKIKNKNKNTLNQKEKTETRKPTKEQRKQNKTEK